jgi:hypothetical protein
MNVIERKVREQYTAHYPRWHDPYPHPLHWSQLIGYALIAALVLACGCSHDPNATVVPGSNSQLSTMEHDGHKWVVLSGTHRGAFHHHPDCPCGVKESAQ